jgi:hypothetical protein
MCLQHAACCTACEVLTYSSNNCRIHNRCDYVLLNRWDPLCFEVKGTVARIQRSAAVRCAAHVLLGLVLQQVFFCASYSSDGFSFIKGVLTALHAVTIVYFSYLAAAAHHV